MPFQAKFTNEDLLAYFQQYGEDITSDHIKGAAAHFQVQRQSLTKRMGKLPQLVKVSRGKWNLTVEEAREVFEKQAKAPAVEPVVQDRNLIPDKDPNYVPFGNFSDVKRIINSNMFYPTFITGLSGNGKTLSVEQACAQLGRELIRVNITIETDEDDLIGGFRLVDGSTV